MYDDAEDQFYQGYPSGGRRGPSVIASIITSILTTVAVFFGLRELDQRGYLGGGKARPAAVSTAGPIQVPNLVGQRLEQGRELLKQRGLLIAIGEERDDASQPPGSIVSQNPPAGAGAASNTTVQVVLARAASGPVVPNLAGMKPEDAVRQLAAKGLQVNPTAKAATTETVAPGLVASTEPPAGAPVQPGAVVTLVVAPTKGSTVPKVVGSRLAKGKKLLEEAGFKVGKTSYKYDPCCGEYIILRQTPAEGATAAAGTAIDLVVNEPG